MTQLQKQRDSLLYIENTDYEFINESCWYCQKEFTNIEDILVDFQFDRYVCRECVNKLDINAVKCLTF